MRNRKGNYENHVRMKDKVKQRKFRKFRLIFHTFCFYDQNISLFGAFKNIYDNAVQTTVRIFSIK